MLNNDFCTPKFFNIKKNEFCLPPITTEKKWRFNRKKNFVRRCCYWMQQFIWAQFQLPPYFPFFFQIKSKNLTIFTIEIDT